MRVLPAVLLSAAITLASGTVAQARGHGGGHHYGSHSSRSYHYRSTYYGGPHHSVSHHYGSIAHQSGVHHGATHHYSSIGQHNSLHHHAGAGHYYGAVARRGGASSTSHVNRGPRSAMPWYAKFDPNRRDPNGRIHRSGAARERFQAMTGHPHGWPGHVVDHVKPLACGGADDPSNMQWQTVAQAKAKDKWERKGCGSGRHGLRRG